MRYLRVVLIAVLLVAPLQAYAALNANVVWEVRTTGTDTNGGGFKSTASGTDLSVFDNKNASGCSSCQSASVNISTTDAVTAGTTTITSATANFSSALIGNTIYIEGGTGAITAGWYEVTAVGSSISITVDRSTGLTTGTGATLNIGGALLTIQKALDLSTVDSMTTYVRGGTYVTTTALTFPARAGQYRTQLIGYNTTRGDLTASTTGRPVVSVTAAVNGLSLNIGWVVSHFDVDGTSTGLKGVLASGGSLMFYHSRVHHFTGLGVDASTYPWIALLNNEIDSNVGGISGSGNGLSVERSYIHGNSGAALTVTGNSIRVVANIIADNSGASSDGLSFVGASTILHNVFYGNGRSGVRATTSYAGNLGMGHVAGNIFAANAAYGIDLSSAPTVKDFPWWDHNAFYANGTAARNNINASPNDVTLTADPFVSAATGDFRLNNTAGGGAALRGVGFPSTIPGTSANAIGYPDIGPYQVRHLGTGWFQ